MRSVVWKVAVMCSPCPVHTSPVVGCSWAPQASSWLLLGLFGFTLHQALWSSDAVGLGIAMHGSNHSTCKMWVAACRYLLKGARVSELTSWAYVNITHHLAVFSCSPAKSGSSSNMLPVFAPASHCPALIAAILSVTGLPHGGFHEGCRALESPAAPREPGACAVCLLQAELWADGPLLETCWSFPKLLFVSSRVSQSWGMSPSLTLRRQDTSFEVWLIREWCHFFHW